MGEAGPSRDDPGQRIGRIRCLGSERDSKAPWRTPNCSQGTDVQTADQQTRQQTRQPPDVFWLSGRGATIYDRIPISRTLVYKEIERGRLHTVKLGRRRGVTARQLDQYLALLEREGAQ